MKAADSVQLITSASASVFASLVECNVSFPASIWAATRRWHLMRRSDWKRNLSFHVYSSELAPPMQQWEEKKDEKNLAVNEDIDELIRNKRYRMKTNWSHKRSLLPLLENDPNKEGKPKRRFKGKRKFFILASSMERASSSTHMSLRGADVRTKIDGRTRKEGRPWTNVYNTDWCIEGIYQ